MRNRSWLSGPIGTLLTLFVIAGVLASVYGMRTRSSDPSDAAVPVAAAAAAVSDVPVTSLTAETYARVVPAGDLTSVTPVGGPADPDAGVTSGTVILVDGWTVSALASARGGVIDPVTRTAAALTFTPVSAAALTGLLAKAPGAVAALIARTATSSSDVACTATGCTVDGQPFDLDLLDRLADVPGLGPVYQAAGIEHAAYAAVIDSTSPLLDVTLGTATAALDATDPAGDDGELVAAPPSPANGYGARVFVLAGGLGRLFPLDPMWIAPTPAAWQQSAWPSTTATQADIAGAHTGPLLIRTIGDSSAASQVSALSASQMTFLTSPTTGCGTVALCTTENLTPTVTGLASAGTLACLNGESNGPSGKAVLLSQKATVRIALTRPAILAGDWSAEPTTDSVLGYDVTAATAVTGDRTFTQQGVFAIDDSGVIAVTGGRNRPALSFADPQLFGGAYRSCGG